MTTGTPSAEFENQIKVFGSTCKLTRHVAGEAATAELLKKVAATDVRDYKKLRKGGPSDEIFELLASRMRGGMELPLARFKYPDGFMPVTWR